MSVLQIAGLRKNWGDNPVVNDITFATRQGEFVSILGPSGCGKSTTLRLIAGLEDADNGRISVDGRDITRLPSAERGISMVFQSYALFPHLNVAQNITFGLSVRGESRINQREKLVRVARLLELESLLERKPAELSGGQQQRVALGRALIAEAPVCLLDEPLSNLDAKLRAEMRNEIRGLQQKLGITMIFVTHDQTEAMSMSDRIVLLRAGHIEQFGTPEELYSQPASSFVGRFIGSPPMNIIAPHLLGEWRKNLPGDVLLGVRPEEIELADQGLPGRIRAIEFLGADSILSVEVGNAQLLVRVTGRPAVGVGRAVCLRWSAASEHHFDITTGARLTHSAATLNTTQLASI